MITPMTTDPWRERSSELRWPDQDAGPYLLTVGWRLMGERWECVSLAVTIAEEAQLRPLQTTDLRGLRLPAITAQGAVMLRLELAAEVEELRAQGRPQSRAEYREATLELRRASEALQAAQPRRVGRPATPDTELQRVSRIYAAAYRDHRPPTKAVAEELGLSYSAAAKRVAHCRLAGFLGEAERGKAGRLGALMGRGDAATLASQIAIDEVRKLRRDDGVDEGPEGPGKP
jgi:hypothetical protein